MLFIIKGLFYGNSKFISKKILVKFFFFKLLKIFYILEIYIIFEIRDYLLRINL